MPQIAQCNGPQRARAVSQGLQGTRVRDLGEFGLIEVLAAAFEADFSPYHGMREPRLKVANGDDSAAWEAPAGTSVLTCDAIAAGSHFDLAHSDPEDVGWRAVAACQSDIAAMGFAPSHSTVTLGLTGDEDVEMVRRIYGGMAQACSRFGGRVVGGDVIRAGTLFLSVAMVGVDPAAGDAAPTRPMTRADARPGDVIAVTGPLGGSAGGLRLLMAGQGAMGGAARSLVRAHLRPEPRVETGIFLAGAGVRCAIDVSDGLGADLGRICRASGVGAVIDLDDLPAHPALPGAFPDDWRRMALSGGEDYQILFAAPSHLVDLARRADPSIAPIGRMEAGEPSVRVTGGDGDEMEAGGGFDHFGS